MLEDLVESPDLFHIADSRLVRPGSVFYALKGAKVDGHDYLVEAKERGAVLAVVDREVPDVGLPLVRVKDVRASLQMLAKRHIEQHPEKKVVGVTGSCGKTTTKEFIATLLAEKFFVEKSPGSWNSQVTLPLTILNLLKRAEILVLEMAMSQKGEMTRLTAIAAPHVAVLTPITYAHSAFFATIEEIAIEKWQIVSSRRLEHAFIHKESMRYGSGYEVFSEEDVRGFTCPLEAKHLLENVGGAIKVARYFGLSAAEIQAGLYQLQPAPHRFERKHYRGVTIIDDAYNANPKSMIAALLNMPRPTATGKRIGVLGSMGELGTYEKEGHENVARTAVEILDELLCIGEACQPMVEIFLKRQKKVTLFRDYDLMKKALEQAMQEGDVVLLKGSNFHKLWNLISC